MYNNLGIHWASSISAFLAVACLPFPWVFYKFGPAIRRHCRYAAESARKLDEMNDRMREIAERNRTKSESGDQKETSPGERSA